MGRPNSVRCSWNFSGGLSHYDLVIFPLDDSYTFFNRHYFLYSGVGNSNSCRSWVDPRVLESVCFSILIGVSVDFVIHFNHAYVHYKGEVPRTERSKYAMVTMGPSILSTAGTTFFSAIVML